MYYGNFTKYDELKKLKINLIKKLNLVLEITKLG